MKVVKTASGKKTIKISKREWQAIGKKAGWVTAYDKYDAWDDEAARRGVDPDDAYDLMRDYGGDIDAARADYTPEPPKRKEPVKKWEMTVGEERRQQQEMTEALRETGFYNRAKPGDTFPGYPLGDKPSDNISGVTIRIIEDGIKEGKWDSVVGGRFLDRIFRSWD